MVLEKLVCIRCRDLIGAFSTVLPMVLRKVSLPFSCNICEPVGPHFSRVNIKKVAFACVYKNVKDDLGNSHRPSDMYKYRNLDLVDLALRICTRSSYFVDDFYLLLNGWLSTLLSKDLSNHRDSYRTSHTSSDRNNYRNSYSNRC